MFADHPCFWLPLAPSRIDLRKKKCQEDGFFGISLEWFELMDFFWGANHPRVCLLELLAAGQIESLAATLNTWSLLGAASSVAEITWKNSSCIVKDSFSHFPQMFMSIWPYFQRPSLGRMFHVGSHIRHSTNHLGNVQTVHGMKTAWENAKWDIVTSYLQILARILGAPVQLHLGQAWILCQVNEEAEHAAGIFR